MPLVESALIVGLSAAELMASVVSYFDRFPWEPSGFDPERTTLEELFSNF